VFRRLAVAAGSASLELVQCVAADGEDATGDAATRAGAPGGVASPDVPAAQGAPLDRWDVVDALDVLVDRSLVALLPGGEDGTPRYRLLESPRAYALERLAEAAERDPVQRRHASAMAALFDAAYADYFSGRFGADAWMRRLAVDLDNARVALACARAVGDVGAELALAATLLRALPPSLHAERMALADAVETRLAAAPAAVAAVRGGAAAEGAPSRALQQRAWIELSCAWADTQKARSRDAARRALALARELAPGADDARFLLYHALCRLAGAAAQAGDVDAALAPLAELQSLEDPAWPPQRLLGVKRPRRSSRGCAAMSPRRCVAAGACSRSTRRAGARRRSRSAT
jgi:hypothetical protein